MPGTEAHLPSVRRGVVRAETRREGSPYQKAQRDVGLGPPIYYSDGQHDNAANQEDRRLVPFFPDSFQARHVF